MSIPEHLGLAPHADPPITAPPSSPVPALSTTEAVSPSLCICARHQQPSAAGCCKKMEKNSSHSLFLSQRTKTFGECSCQLLTGSGLMNERTFQKLINRIVSQKLFHRKSRRHIPAPTCSSRRNVLLHNSNRQNFQKEKKKADYMHPNFTYLEVSKPKVVIRVFTITHGEDRARSFQLMSPCQHQKPMP